MHGVSVVGRDHKKDEFRSKVKITLGSAAVLGALFSLYLPLNDCYSQSPDRSRYELVSSADRTIGKIQSSLSERSIDSLDVRNPTSDFAKDLATVQRNLTDADYSSLASSASSCVSDNSRRTSDCLGVVSDSIRSELRSTFSNTHDLDALISLIKSLAPIAGLCFAFGALGLISDRFPSKPSSKYLARMDSDGA
jgi:hypothetical protein